MRFTIYLKDDNARFRGMMFLNDSNRLADLIQSYEKLDAFRNAIDFSSILKSKFNDNSIFDTMLFSEKEYASLIENVKQYQSHNIDIRIQHKSAKPKVKLDIKSNGEGGFTTRVIVDGNPLTPEEYKKLSLNHRQLVFIRGSWIRADADFLRKFENKTVSLEDLIKCDTEFQVKQETVDFEIKNCEKFKSHQIDAINRMLQGFKSGNNILLADDMGLGKTASVIGVLNTFVTEHTKPVLIVVPKSLVGNWHEEIKKFSDMESVNLENCYSIEDGKIYVCTYGFVIHKYDVIKDVDWSCIILDEAQQIKNFATKTSTALRSLKSEHRIAMTGTPIENSADDLWSIFQFLNPNLLGSKDKFNSLICSSNRLEKLISLMSPYIIRRMKSDIADLNLPEKEEIKIEVELDSFEKKLYNSIIDNYEREKAKGKSTILAYLNSLKQVCGSPKNLFNVSIMPSKLRKLRDLIILSNYKKFVVFTQYVETAKEIFDSLKELYKSEGALINGSMSAKERTKTAEDFQNGKYPYIVITLKSGNCGLTLTEANHLVHYDRWWNPAVENQASDRIYRIGQKNDVKIYKLIAKGTIESKIDKILGDKMYLFDSVVNAFVENKEKLERIK